MPIRTFALAAAAALVAVTTISPATATAGDGLVTVWSSTGTAHLTPDLAKDLSRSVPGGVRALFVPRTSISAADLGAGSLYAELDAAGRVGTVDPALAEALKHVPRGTPLRMLSSTSVGLPNGHADLMDHDEGDCVGAAACATITVSIEVSGVGAKCPSPTIFGICIPTPSPPLPVFKLHTEQTVDVVRTDDAIDTLTPSRPHFRNTNGDDWGHKFQVTTVNPNQRGAGAHYVAVSDGEWAPIDPGTISFPPGISADIDTTLISGFCLRWDVRYPGGVSGSRQDNFQLRGDMTLGIFTGHQWIHNEGTCTL